MRIPRGFYWTAAVTRFSQEQRAASHVERQGFTYWLPYFWDLLPSGKERRTLLFPGYIMILVGKSGWGCLCGTKGIARVLFSSDVPARIPREEIESLQAMEDSSGVVCLHPRLRDGDSVKIGSLSGIVQGTPALGRCNVLTKLLGHEVIGNYDVRSVELAA